MSDDLLLPDPLTDRAGTKVTTTDQWEKVRRPEILELFRTHVYGKTPDRKLKVDFNRFEQGTEALAGKAIRKQVSIVVTSGKQRLHVNLLMYLPKIACEHPVPVMLILNFGGNHTVHSDPDIAIANSYIPKRYSPAESFRGKSASRYPVERLIARGYGFATAYYGDLDPDFDDGFKNGIHGLVDAPEQRSEASWGAVGAWAWGLSRIMDYFETDKDIDQTKVAVLGHSRLGKTALWAGAQDKRFSIVISNNSGCTGAALARHKKGETVALINEKFPHWFCANYRKFNNNEDQLPVDQHQLLALIAPRPVYVASGSEDLWADPQNEFLSCVHAEPVYELYGLKGLGTQAFPAPEKPLQTGHIGYHLRTGKHDLTTYDWDCFMDFADKQWKRGQQSARHALADVEVIGASGDADAVFEQVKGFYELLRYLKQQHPALLVEMCNGGGNLMSLGEMTTCDSYWLQDARLLKPQKLLADTTYFICSEDGRVAAVSRTGADIMSKGILLALEPRGSEIINLSVSRKTAPGKYYPAPPDVNRPDN